jgi:D-3-phosphoglycerate dehydrogenase
MAKIIILDDLSEDGLNLLRAAAGIEIEIRTGLKGEDLRKALNEADGAICRSGVKITAEILKGNTRLRAVARAGVGVDNIDCEAATRQGIVVMNTPGGNTISTAEQTLALMYGLVRNIGPAYQSLVEKRWDRKKFMGTQLAGKTLGIVGLGRIGQAVASRAVAMEMKVLGYDPFLSAARAKELGVQMVATAHDLLPLVDVLTVHTPLNDETRNLIGAKEIKMMKKGARLINCARGGIYNEAALVEGLKSGHLGGVALDVYEEEPCTTSPLFGMPGVLCTPHLGASTEEAQTSVAVEAAELLVDFFTSGAIKNAVNMAPLDPKTLESIRGYLDVAYRLGLLLAQIERCAPNKCRLCYKGEVAKKDTRLLTSAFAAGLLANAVDGVNIVNAEVLLHERGIEIVEERCAELGELSSLVTAELVSAEGTVSAGGTLFGNSMPRLVEFNGCRMESVLDGTMVLFSHRDQPGVIGSIGTIFGRHQVNIAQMAVGRLAVDKPGGEAIGVLSLDSVPPASALAEMVALPQIARAWTVKLPAAGHQPPWMAG